MLGICSNMFDSFCSKHGVREGSPSCNRAVYALGIAGYDRPVVSHHQWLQQGMWQGYKALKKTWLRCNQRQDTKTRSLLLVYVLESCPASTKHFLKAVIDAGFMFIWGPQKIVSHIWSSPKTLRRAKGLW